MARKQANGHSLIDSVRTRARSLRFGLLKRLHRPGRRALWTFDRASVARGVAIGLFFGVMTPVAQIVVAVFVAVALRANLVATSLSTFVTNPATLPFVYYYAYLVGGVLAGRDTALEPGVAADVTASEAAAEQALEVGNWWTTLLEWASSIALPFLFGLILLATVIALAGYLLIHAGWALCEAIRSYRKSRSDTP